MTDCKHLLQQKIMTAQNAVFAQSVGDRRRVEIGLHQCVVDLGVKVDGTYNCDRYRRTTS